MRGLAEELVKEMVNEALFKIVRFIDRLRADTVAGVRSWLGLVTVSTARSVLRKEARHLRIAEADAAPAGGEGCSEDWLSGNLAHGHALDGLRESLKIAARHAVALVESRAPQGLHEARILGQVAASPGGVAEQTRAFMLLEVDGLPLEEVCEILTCERRPGLALTLETTARYARRGRIVLRLGALRALEVGGALARSGDLQLLEAWLAPSRPSRTCLP